MQRFWKDLYKEIKKSRLLSDGPWKPGWDDDVDCTWAGIWVEQANNNGKVNICFRIEMDRGQDSRLTYGLYWNKKENSKYAELQNTSNWRNFLTKLKSEEYGLTTINTQWWVGARKTDIYLSRKSFISRFANEDTLREEAHNLAMVFVNLIKVFGNDVVEINNQLL